MIPAESRYVFDDVDQEAPTKPGCEPLELWKSESSIPLKPLPSRDWRMAHRVVLWTALALSSLVVFWDVHDMWDIGGWVGLGVALLRAAGGASVALCLVGLRRLAM